MESHLYPIEQWVRIGDILHVRKTLHGSSLRFIEDGLWLIWPYLRSFERDSISIKSSEVTMLIMRSGPLDPTSSERLHFDALILAHYEDMSNLIKAIAHEHRFDIDGYIEQVDDNITLQFDAHTRGSWVLQTT